MAWQNPKTDWTAADGVRDTDFNRIEGNILALYEKTNLVADLELYVSPSGNDTTGDGSYGRPFQTIGKAIKSIPINLNGHTATVSIESGSYAETVTFTDITGNVIFNVADGATITSLVVSGCHVYLEGALTVTNGMELTRGAVFESSYDFTVNRGIEVTGGSTFICNGTLTVNNASNALRVSEGSRAYVWALEGADNTNGLVAITGGIASYSFLDIAATTQRHTATGGRIYSGAQTSVPNY